MKTSILIAISLFFASNFYSQNCSQNSDLISIPGNLTVKSPKLPTDFKPTEKINALKTISQIESLFTKNFNLNGGYAKYWFHNPPFTNQTGLNNYTNYYGLIGFYQYVCVNGKKTNSDEYTVDFRVMVNPSLERNLHVGGSDFYLDEKKKSGFFVPFCYYQHLNDKDAEIIINGNGFLDETFGNDYKVHTDVYRHWYISKSDEKILEKVSRKEFLQSLLQFYEKEKLFYVKEFERKRNDGIKYMETYKKNGNSVMYNNSLDDKNKAENALVTIENAYQNKKRTAENILKNKSEDWLLKPTKINPESFKNFELYGDKTRNYAESFALENASSLEQQETIYKWNSTYFKNIQAGKPTFFDVRFRYKAGEEFSAGILNNFMHNFDFNALKQILK